jgi:endonuclease/exonuclease/phosphatase family metal-dependent hydrolase
MQSLTVASFNIHGGRRPRWFLPWDVVEACRQLDTDVLALQEVLRPDGEQSDADRVADALGYEVHHTWTGRAQLNLGPRTPAPRGKRPSEPRCQLVGRTGALAGNSDWGQALLTRVPSGPVSEHRLDGFLFDGIDRAVMTTDIELDGGRLTVCASHFPHLEHFSPLLRWRLRGVVPDAHQPAVLMGDFNMWRWVTRFIVPGWRDTVRGATWPTPRPMFQIDHVLTTPPVVTTDAEVIRVGKSDHLPVRARVSIG